MEAVLASNNKNKLIEITSYLKNNFDKIYTLKELNINIDIEETGTTFLENAIIKAKTISELTGKIAIADDSGLCVESLKYAPGIYSARFAGEPCNDENNNQKLLKELHKVGAQAEKDRKAYYVSVVVLYYPDGTYIYGEGKTYGTILNEYRGNGGFGYDPLFLCDDLNKTYAEIDLATKNTVSHRARALQALVNKL